MQKPTITAIHRFSIIAMMTFLFSYGLDAQVKIKEKIEIAPKASNLSSPNLSESPCAGWNCYTMNPIYSTITRGFTLEYSAEVLPEWMEIWFNSLNILD